MLYEQGIYGTKTNRELTGIIGDQTVNGGQILRMYQNRRQRSQVADSTTL